MVPVDVNGATMAAEAGGSVGTAPLGERQVVGSRYELLGLLGAGGMGNVYKARDVELDEVVALKVLQPHLVGAPGALERFRREVKLARRVTHPNVARVFDLGEHDGDRILTMEFVDGESLAALLRREGRLPLARSVEIARAICAGVGAAHAAGVIHRDLKPDNVLIGRDGRVVVADFGIARAAAEGARTAGFVGTPAYMAPEQIDERSAIDHRADVYAFGAVFYEMLVGQPAWQGESVWAVASARLLEPPPDPVARRGDLPKALSDVVLRCMARDRDARIGTMAEVERALTDVELPAPSHAAATRDAPASPRVEMGLTTTGTDKKVAVLPFENLGPSEQDYIADGLTEDLIDALSVARGLRVRSRGVVMKFKATRRDLRDVGRELDVQVVVEGSVRRIGQVYRIAARLVSVADGFQLWARRFEVPEAELLAHNDVIAQAVAAALSVDLETPARAASDAQAVDLYLRGRAAHHRSFSGDKLAPVILFDQVLALTPNDPRALAGRAMAGAHQMAWDASSRRTAFDCAERAVSLAPMLADAHLALANVRYSDGDIVGAIAPACRAVRLAPGSGEAHEQLGRILTDIDSEEGVPHLQAALALEPTFEFPYINLTAFHEYRGNHEVVDELLRDADDRGVAVRFQLEMIFVLWRRDRELATRLLSRADRNNPVHVLGLPWVELVAHGTPPVAMQPPMPPGAKLQHFMERFLLRTAVDVACFLGDLPRALAVLTQMDAIGAQDVGWLERLPLLEPLRALPEVAPIRVRFAERAARMLAEYRRAVAA